MNAHRRIHKHVLDWSINRHFKVWGRFPETSRARSVRLTVSLSGCSRFPDASVRFSCSALHMVQQHLKPLQKSHHPHATISQACRGAEAGRVLTSLSTCLTLSWLALCWPLAALLFGCLAVCFPDDDWQLVGRLVYILPANFFSLPVCLLTICLPHCLLLKEKEEIAPVNMPFSTDTVMQPSSAPISHKDLTLVSPVA